MKKFRFWIRNYFGFSQRETNGFFVLLLLMLLVISLPGLFDWLFPAPDPNFATDRKILDSLVAAWEKAPAEPVRPRLVATRKASAAITYFPFNPNQISSGQFQSLGVPGFIAKRIVNYREKGGKFRIKKDVLKIYGFPPDVYAQLEPYIQLPDSLMRPAYSDHHQRFVTSKPTEFTPSKKAAIIRFDLNQADTTQLMQIRGIGPALSKRILKFRESLGGFGRLAQVREVYGLDSAVVDELFKYAYLTEQSPIRKLRVNSATVEELDAHPYIAPKVARVIVAYRQQHGKFTSVESVYNIRVLDRPTLDKLAPYLSFE